MPDLARLLSPSAAAPRYLQISAGLRAQMTEGSLSAGRRLPASRALAQDLGVARSTVVLAYDQLVAEGYLESRRGSGIYVCDIAPLTTPMAVAATATAVVPAISGLLAPGTPDPEVFPVQPWAKIIARVARMAPKALVHLDDPFGDPELRQQIAAYAGRWRGITATADQVLVTSGASAGLELALALLVREGQLALEAPGYVPTQMFAAARGWQVNWMPVTASGVQLPPHPSPVTVLTPSHQFPLGGSLPIAMRQAFLKAAAGCGGWIVEDDFDSEFRYAGQPLAAMAALDHDGRCIYVGTFSKTFSHALRLGYLILPPGLVDRFRAALRHPTSSAAVTAQRPLADFMASGQYDRHIRRARRLYAQRYGAAVKALEGWPAELGQFRRHEAGMQIALHLDQAQDEQTLVTAANAAGFAIRGLSGCDPSGQAQGLLIGFCQSQPEDIAGQYDALRAVLQGCKNSAD
ncbi:MocR-like pyridoxine biosynthesis transcription factor PdxR [Parasedimentitalea psychrophila]|uniref:PLP-dependent aminotransferase family protein n=1 Tax=Parasedimentitalea psychrophila TaxID=2997337 RepID=A0A9Y2L2D2_9RHOB|nr:PLP-dependent aminotransferase family protein [Parasedimentitalea psychrophila]WIY26406.1 PLP-dependent aminotransferase family protein [Parasedimentitalea psychrophila]